MEDLIEDEDGAPLPPELQRDSPLYNAMKAFWLSNDASLSIDDFVGKMMAAIAPFWTTPVAPVMSDDNSIRCWITDRTWPSHKAFDIKTCVNCSRKIDVQHEAWGDGPLCWSCLTPAPKIH